MKFRKNGGRQIVGRRYSFIKIIKYSESATKSVKGKTAWSPTTPFF